MRTASIALAIPGLLLAGPLVGYAFGWAAEEYLGFPAWVRVAGLVLGLISGLRESLMVLKKLEIEQNRTSEDEE